MDIDNVFVNQPETKWVNKQRTLIVTSKNISDRITQLFHDLHELFPHFKKESKLERGDISQQIKEMCLAHSCRSFIYFETHRKHDLYMWIGRFPKGPSIKYHVENWHNCQDLKLTGNCIKGSRPVLSFDNSFSSSNITELQKELFIHAFNVPKHHPKSMPCCDRVLTFLRESEQSQNIWIRHYQISYEKVGKEIVKNELIEIGPRIVLKPVLVLEGCISGTLLYKDGDFQTFAKKKQIKSLELKRERQTQEKKQKKKEKMLSKLEIEQDEIENIFERNGENNDDQWVDEDEEEQDYDLNDFQEA